MEVNSVHLKNISEFDNIKHKDDIIEFEPGGEVGDKEWTLQFQHNTSVILERNFKEKIKDIIYPLSILNIHLAYPWKVGDVSLKIYINDLLLDNIEHINIINTVLYYQKPAHKSNNIYLLQEHAVKSFYIPESITFPKDFKEPICKKLKIELFNKNTYKTRDIEIEIENKSNIKNIVYEENDVIIEIFNTK